MDDHRQEQKDQIRLAIAFCRSAIVLALSLSALCLSAAASIVIRIVRGQ